MNWVVPRMWEGGDVWIIGGGPSICDQFEIPKELVAKVIAGEVPISEYSPYLSYLHDKHVIGVNAAYLLGTWIDIVFFGDLGFFLQHKVNLAKFPGLKVTCHSGAGNNKWVKFLMRSSHSFGISPTTNAVSWNGNSGAAAISVAAHAGAKRIILLGFDMKLNVDSRQHWHNVYGRGFVDQQNMKLMKSLPFRRHLRGFPAIREDAKRMGIEILNANPDSAIEEFRKVTVKELMNECH